jgi:hypothetical protein
MTVEVDATVQVNVSLGVTGATVPMNLNLSGLVASVLEARKVELNFDFSTGIHPIL